MAVLKWSLVKADWRRFALYCLPHGGGATAVRYRSMECSYLDFLFSPVVAILKRSPEQGKVPG